MASYLSLQAAVTAFLSWLMWTIISRLYFHPLSKYPGPIHWRVSRFWYMRSIRNGSLVHVVRDIHRQYQSDVVRVAPNELSYIRPDCLRDIYGKRTSSQKALPKDRLRLARPRPGETITIHSASSGPVHDRLRKALSPSFSDHALSEEIPFIQSYVDKLIGALEAHSKRNEVIDLQKWFGYCIFDITCYFTFSEDSKCLEEDTYRDWAGTLTHWLIAGTQHAACQYYSGLYELRNVLFSRSATANFMRMMTINRERVQRRMKTDVNHHDFIGRLKNCKPGLSDVEIQANSALLLVAGTSTAHAALTGIMFHLLKTPQAMKKASNEIRARFSNAQNIVYSTVKDLPYLNAVINEGLRIATPVPVGLTRYVPEGGATICGDYVPKGTIISYMSWAAATSPSNFNEASKFVPERWLERFPSLCSDIRLEDFANDKKQASAPFLVGPHDCIGQNLAWIEMRLIFAHILFRFDLEVDGGPEALGAWEDQQTYAAWIMNPLPVRVETIHKK